MKAAPRLLLFGGTFDPPHNGHMNNLRAAMAAVQPGRVVVMPAGTPPHKAASATPGAVRLEMCACFRALGPEVEVSGWEIAQGGRSYTVNTLEMLHAAQPEARLFMTVGSDMLQSFAHWYRWQRILQLATLVVQSRNPGDAAALWGAAAPLQAAGGRVLFAHAAALPCASSEIRAGRAGPGMLPPPVPELIARYGLYQNKEGNDRDL